MLTCVYCLDLSWRTLKRTAKELGHLLAAATPGACAARQAQVSTGACAFNWIHFGTPPTKDTISSRHIMILIYIYIIKVYCTHFLQLTEQIASPSHTGKKHHGQIIENTLSLATACPGAQPSATVAYFSNQQSMKKQWCQTKSSHKKW